ITFSMPSIKGTRRRGGLRPMTASAVMRRPHGRLYGLDDFDIARASAKIARQSGSYLILGWRGISTQQRFGRHDHSRRTEPALRAQFLVKCALQSAEAALRCE